MSDGNWIPAKLDGSPGVAVVEPQTYSSYQVDFGSAKPAVPFRGATIIVNRKPHPANTQREHTYWHMVTRGGAGNCAHDTHP